MKFSNKVVALVFFQTLFCLNNCDLRVTFSCDGDNVCASKDEAGPPRKCGSNGKPGTTGTQGNAPDLTNLERTIREMSQSLSELQRYTRLLPSK